MLKHPLRSVVKSYLAQGPNHAKNAFTRTLGLECGHTISRKASMGLPHRMRCTLCPPVER